MASKCSTQGSNHGPQGTSKALAKSLELLQRALFPCHNEETRNTLARPRAPKLLPRAELCPGSNPHGPKFTKTPI
ncbi:hypothetical protein AHAS_Ahas14G0098600 [Arachis hypogaea]